MGREQSVESERKEREQTGSDEFFAEEVGGGSAAAVRQSRQTLGRPLAPLCTHRYTDTWGVFIGN